MKNITYPTELHNYIGAIPLKECLSIIIASEKEEVSGFDVEQQLAPIAGTILCELFHNERAKFEILMSQLKVACSELITFEESQTITLVPTEDGEILT